MTVYSYLLAPQTPIPKHSDRVWLSRYCCWNLFTLQVWQELESAGST